MTLSSIVQSQKNYFHSNATKDPAFRKKNLLLLYEAIEEHEDAILDALNKDLGKSKQEAYITEVGTVKKALRNAVKNVNKWAKPKRHKTPLHLFGTSGYSMKEPYGVVLILAPWNFPFFLSIYPLIGALAAGNCAIIKTSRHAPHTAAAIDLIINGTFSSKYVSAINDAYSYDEILSCTYDYIFFTGSERVGRIVMRSASETLTPVTLELGGKNPCIIHESADLKDAAKKIAWGKIVNAGQCCVAPDYVVVPDHMKEEFVDLVKQYFKEFVPHPLENPDYPHIVNLHHFMRLRNLITKEKSVRGGKSDDKTFKIAPAIFHKATFDSPIMKDEIFGPILAVIGYDDFDVVLDTIKRRPKPLACYVFSKNNSISNRILEELSFGGGCVNDIIMHVSNDYLPFGGVGTSGMGNYHGKYSFDTFSHEKGILIRRTNLTDNPLRYPPYKEENLKKIRITLK